ncbi:putative Cyclin,  Cyclin-related protein [Trachipleistophora hominis]|uniref:Putative Cyclin, Cyclin-related protein n=1 Tax=Trachipleistophora hominis TaxID=72359 RepID=L7JVG7_TRAHO|nr:putative Cyclin,  Cyclin-related protein [Trachipleistophora hominis]
MSSDHWCYHSPQKMLHYSITSEYYRTKLLASPDDIHDFMKLSRAMALKRSTFIMSVNLFYRMLITRPDLKSDTLKCSVILLSCKIMENFRGISFITEAAKNYLKSVPGRKEIIHTELIISETLNFDYKYIDYYSYCESKVLSITRDKSLLICTFSFLTDCSFLPLLAFFKRRNVALACIFLALKVLKPGAFKSKKNVETDCSNQEIAAVITTGMKISIDSNDRDSTPAVQNLAIESQKRRKLFYRKLKKTYGNNEKSARKYFPYLKVEQEFLRDLESAFEGLKYSAIEIHFICNELLDLYIEML